MASRAGIVNMHSLVWNQFGSEAYTDMLRYAWHKTDPSFSDSELSSRPPPPMVHEINFNFDKSRRCEMNCTNFAFIKCAHCGKHLCLKHFLDRACFHEVNDARAGPSMENAGQSSQASVGTTSTSTQTIEYNHHERSMMDQLDTELATLATEQISTTTESDYYQPRDELA